MTHAQRRYQRVKRCLLRCSPSSIRERECRDQAMSPVKARLADAAGPVGRGGGAGCCFALQHVSLARSRGLAAAVRSQQRSEQGGRGGDVINKSALEGGELAASGCTFAVVVLMPGGGVARMAIGGECACACEHPLERATRSSTSSAAAAQWLRCCRRG